MSACFSLQLKEISLQYGFQIEASSKGMLLWFYRTRAKAGNKESQVLVIFKLASVRYIFQLGAMATWTEFNHTKAVAVEDRKGGGGTKTANQNNKHKKTMLEIYNAI